MEEKKEKENVIVSLAKAINPDSIQKYLLGTKKNGQPRAVYDIVRDYTKPKKKKKSKKTKKVNNYDFYLTRSKDKKKKKDKKKYWHI